jgi:CxxC motif-containing protein (DUF1111 family)
MKSLKVMAVVAAWAAVTLFAVGRIDTVETQAPAPEAPAGFDVTSNGHAEQFCANQDALTDSPNSPGIPDDECAFDTAVEEFTGPEDASVGLGPIFNGVGCGECHIAPNLGGGSQIVERRAGRTVNGVFTDHPGGSLIQDRALLTHLQFTERTDNAFTNTMALRASLSLFGDGFVEAVSNNVFIDIANRQPAGQRGLILNVPVSERPGTTRVGRFGIKGQQASLLSFSADAYVNEMGITSPLQPDEPTSNGVVIPNDPVPGVDDEGVDVELFALFMRSLKVPPRGPITADVAAGQNVFNAIDCDVCHTPSMVTVPTNTLINGGALRTTAAVSNKTIRPFGDFLLHDVGTGDGIVQNGGAASRNRVRTVPLWGLRARGRFMHDLASHNVTDAIRRHGNQALASRQAFDALSTTDRNRLLAFLNSL